MMDVIVKCEDLKAFAVITLLLLLCMLISLLFTGVPVVPVNISSNVPIFLKIKQLTIGCDLLLEMHSFLCQRLEVVMMVTTEIG